MPNLPLLSEYIRVNLHVPVAVEGDQLILEISLSNGRTQTVLVSVRNYKDCKVIEVRSRCGVISDAKTVRALLKRNFTGSIGGLAMDKVNGQNVVDYLQRLVVTPELGVNIAEFLDTISYIGMQADLIESKLSNADVF
jgi:hypothetical protein